MKIDKRMTQKRRQTKRGSEITKFPLPTLDTDIVYEDSLQYILIHPNTVFAIQLLTG